MRRDCLTSPKDVDVRLRFSQTPPIGVQLTSYTYEAHQTKDLHHTSAFQMLRDCEEIGLIHSVRGPLGYRSHSRGCDDKRHPATSPEFSLCPFTSLYLRSAALHPPIITQNNLRTRVTDPNLPFKMRRAAAESFGRAAKTIGREAFANSPRIGGALRQYKDLCSAKSSASFSTFRPPSASTGRSFTTVASSVQSSIPSFLQSRYDPSASESAILSRARSFKRTEDTAEFDISRGPGSGSVSEGSTDSTATATARKMSLSSAEQETVPDWSEYTASMSASEKSEPWEISYTQSGTSGCQASSLTPSTGVSYGYTSGASKDPSAMSRRSGVSSFPYSYATSQQNLYAPGPDSSLPTGVVRYR
jgi:hypothetical protein